MDNKIEEILANIPGKEIMAQWPPLAVNVIEALKTCVLSEQREKESLVSALRVEYENKLQELRDEISDLTCKLNKVLRDPECCTLGADDTIKAVGAHSAPVQPFLVSKNSLLDLSCCPEEPIKKTDSNTGEQNGTRSVAPSIQPKWDRYEAAFLLKYYLKVEAGEMLRADAIAIVSKTLRQRAIANGFVINDVFRNKNGISMQMEAIKHCYN